MPSIFMMMSPAKIAAHFPLYVGGVYPPCHERIIAVAKHTTKMSCITGWRFNSLLPDLIDMGSMF